MAKASIQAIIDWLRAGFPEGVPARDSFALLPFLKQSLSDEQLQQVVNRAIDFWGTSPEQIDTERLRDVVRAVFGEEPTDDDMKRVGDRLLAVGGPRLVEVPSDGADAHAGDPTGQQRAAEQVHGSDVRAMPRFLNSVLSWLRAGYPEGVPAHDYTPILALLRRQLTDEEVEQVGRALADEGADEVSAADIGTMITKLTDELPSTDDLDRVRARLRAAGVPVEPSRH